MGNTSKAVVPVTVEDLTQMLSESKWREGSVEELEDRLNTIRDTLRFILHDSGTLIDPDIAANDGTTTSRAQPLNPEIRRFNLTIQCTKNASSYIDSAGVRQVLLDVPWFGNNKDIKDISVEEAVGNDAVRIEK